MRTVKKNVFYLSLILLITITFSQCSSENGGDSSTGFDWSEIAAPTEQEPVTVGYHFENADGFPGNR